MAEPQATTPAFNSDCSKCKAPMTPGPALRGHLAGAKFTTTGYLCACGHWNNLKLRKGWETRSAGMGEPEGAQQK